jgi:hypothetical protein
MLEHWTYRRDRIPEAWHIVPAGEHGAHGRTLCGEPRQGTRLSEAHAEVEPLPPDTLCPRCVALAPARGIPLAW